MKRRQRAAAVVAITTVAACASACGACDGAPPKTDNAAAAPSSTPALPVSDTVMVHHAGKDWSVTLQGEERVLLADQLPQDARDPTKWVHLIANGSQKRTLTLQRFGEVYGGDYQVYLYLDPLDRASIGLFRPIREDMPTHVKARLRKPHLELVDVERVQVLLTQPEPTEKVTFTSLALEIGGKLHQLSPEQLRDIPVAPQQRRRGGRHQGWPLLQVLKLAKPQAAEPLAWLHIASVQVHTRDGNVTVLPMAKLRARSTRATLRHNRRGLLMLRLDKNAPDGAAGQRQQLRDVVKVVVTSGGR